MGRLAWLLPFCTGEKNAEAHGIYEGEVGFRCWVPSVVQHLATLLLVAGVATLACREPRCVLW